MEANIHDLVRESSSTTGSVLSIDLDAEVGYARFSDASTVGETLYYTIHNEGNREVGIGTVQANNVLDRTTPLTTLVGGVYTSPASTRITLAGLSQVAISPSAETLHSIEKEQTARIFLLIGA